MVYGHAPSNEVRGSEQTYGATKLAEHYLSGLERAQEWPNGAPSRLAVGRTSFYEWKQLFQIPGVEGLKNQRPSHMAHRQTTPPDTVKRVEELTLYQLGYGFNQLEALLSPEGRPPLALTVLKILHNAGLDIRYDRCLPREPALQPRRRSN